jgi:hypothetical protein
MRLKQIPETVLDLDIHQAFDYRKIEIASQTMSAEQLRDMLLAATRATMVQHNVVKFLMVSK